MNRLAAGALQSLKSQLLRQPRTRGGGGSYPGGKFWSEGTQEGYNGFLFGEVPNPSGTRKWLWWEPWYYVGYGGFAVGVFLIYHAKPPEALDIQYWAKPRAKEELELEMRMLDKLESRPDLKQRLSAVCAALNMVDGEAYDLVMMRNEYKVKLGLHSGRVPDEYAAVLDELAA